MNDDSQKASPSKTVISTADKPTHHITAPSTTSEPKKITLKVTPKKAAPILSDPEASDNDEILDDDKLVAVLDKYIEEAEEPVEKTSTDAQPTVLQNPVTPQQKAPDNIHRALRAKPATRTPVLPRKSPRLINKSATKNNKDVQDA